MWLQLSTINSHTSSCQVEEEGVPPIGLKGKVLQFCGAMRGWVCTIFAFHFGLLVSIAKLRTRNFWDEVASC